MNIPQDWTFKADEVATHFESHVREQLPWYDLVTGAVAHLARCYMRPSSTVYDIGASTGNIGRAIADTLEARQAQLISLEASEQMAQQFKGPGRLIVAEAENYPYEAFSVSVLFLVAQFLPKAGRKRLLSRLQEAVEPGGAIILVDRFETSGGYFGQSLARLTLSGKLAQGATPKAILDKELSLSGVQRPLSHDELTGNWKPFFKFSDFEGYLFEC